MTSLNGHRCMGLTKFFDNVGGCVPTFYQAKPGQEIIISGCDATNNEPITHCPFCGTIIPTEKI